MVAAKFNWVGDRVGFDQLREYLGHLPRYAWIKGLTLHHTGNPPLSEWRGLKSMQGTMEYYRDVKKWSAGPHLFVAIGATNPAHDGVFLGTPLSMPGIHAGACNSSMIGLEFVGNYDSHDYNSTQRQGLLEVLDAIYDWAMLPVNAGTFKGHRECLKNKTCPGAAISMPVMRELLAKYRNSAPLYTEWLVRWPYSRVRQTPTASGKILKTLSPSKTPLRVKRYDLVGANVTLNGITSNKWVELLEGGYMWQELLLRNDTIL